MSSSTNKAPKKIQTSSVRNTQNVTKSRKSGPGQSITSQAGRKSMFTGASRTVLSSASRRNINLGTQDKSKTDGRPPVQVFDDQGHDVTPLPLLLSDPNYVRNKQSNILATDSSVGTPTDLMSQASIYQTGTVTASVFGGPFTRSVFSQSQSERSTSASMTDDLSEPHHEMAGSTTEITRVIREEPREELTETDLDRTVTLELTETETIWLLDMPGVCVSSESEEAQTVRDNNNKYKELQKSRVGNDRYVGRGMNTFNFPLKTKYVQTTKIGHQESGMTASNWDMYDTYTAIAEATLPEEGDEFVEGSLSRPISSTKTNAEKEDIGKDTLGTTDSKALDSQVTMTSMTSESIMQNKDIGIQVVPEENSMDRDRQIMQSEELLKALVIVERAINLNSYQPKQALYRGLPIVEDIDKRVEVPEDEDNAHKKALQAALHDLGPALDRLWGYQCHMTKGRNVSCLAWNKDNPDILAVGYGQFEYNKQKGGLVCCWSIKNPEFPERFFITESGVTAVDFSKAHANLLAVGLHNGTIAIYNVRNTTNEPILDSFEAEGKHTGPVWQLNWIEKERGSGDERSEVLVSISTDGRVTQWSIRKGFESYDLMKLKRVATKTMQGKVKKTEALISKHAGGLCFNFHAKDSNIYLAGTEDGHIHKCSCSYNEQYLDSYHGHTGPVYKIQWSPFAQDVFLSCSGDWTVRLWHQDRTSPVITFHSSTKSVPDLCWSPRSSTVFACVNEGAIEIWDLSQSVLDPIIINTPHNGAKLSSVAFSPNADCVLVGDAEGAVQVIELKSMPQPPQQQAEALLKVIQASLASQLKAK